MGIRQSFFGYKRGDVDKLLEDYSDIIEIQKRDIKYLKQDNAELKSTLFEVSTELAQLDKNNNTKK